MHGKKVLIAAICLTLLAAGAGVGAGILTPPEKPRAKRVIDIPPGAAKKVKDDPSLVPSRIDARVGERLIIKNRDSQTHQIGPFSVQPASSVEYPLLVEGRYVGICSLKPGRSFVLQVHPASASRQ